MKDYTNKIENIFDLILIAAKKARQIQVAEKNSLIRKKNKCTVIALHEIKKDLLNK